MRAITREHIGTHIEPIMQAIDRPDESNICSLIFTFSLQTSANKNPIQIPANITY